MDIRDFLSPDEKKRVVEAVREAERNTSGEIRVHLENHCHEDVLDHAAFIFDQLEMQKTKQRNGVLFYVAVKDHQLAILGDAGINQVVPRGFWDAVRDEMVKHFKENRYADGLVAGLHLAGQQLSTHFPYSQKDDENELSDDISFGKN
jgi:uncharacterized membrane protein